MRFVRCSNARGNDAMSAFIQHDAKRNEYVRDIREASKFLLETVIPSAAAEFAILPM